MTSCNNYILAAAGAVSLTAATAGLTTEEEVAGWDRGSWDSSGSSIGYIHEVAIVAVDNRSIKK